MQSERLIFRNFNLDDLEDVYEFGSDKEVSKYVTWETHKSLLESEKILKDIFIANKYIFAIVEKKF